ncbi:MAG TPA: DUF885 domain-containing protein [Chitinophagaceae bacterium]|nr:DUF885 domain-containing protein [Chitinophagaceae bacterium]
MKKLFLFFTLLLVITHSLKAQPTTTDNKELSDLLTDFFDEGIKLSPVNATSIGDNRYNDKLPAEFTDSYRKWMKDFYNGYLVALGKFKRDDLNDNDKLNYDIFKWRLQTSLEGLSFSDNRIPFTQFGGAPLTIAQFGSGTVVQPFKTVKDYDNWISRAKAFTIWADSAILYFRKGITEKIVLPKSLVVKMIPQMEGFVTTDPEKSVFYGPVKNMPADFSEADKKRLTNAYINLIKEQIVPAYQKLASFLKNEYLPQSRSSSGIGSLPGGEAWYNFNLRQTATVNKTADELFNTGLEEVKRIRTEMEKVKTEVGFTGDLNAFFDFMKTDPQFYPYKTQEEIVKAYQAIGEKITPNLQRLFLHAPKTAFEIRPTEAFRAATSAAQYNAGLADGSRPGIFYVPIVDPSKVPVRESLFIHEAIPGHHYQIMLQRENEKLPSFRRYSSFTAYAEGWGLYCESLGKELGLYTDPYQYMRALGDEIHRAIRLVVDPGIHAKGWSREEAIKYMMENEPISEPAATAEIERYMAIPGQAIAYKVGALKLQQLRAKYSKQLGKSFNIARFHDEVLKDGAMPLNILEKKMDKWVKKGGK